MKRILIVLLLILFAGGSAAFAQAPETKQPKSDQPTKVEPAPTASQILSKYVEALGGREAILKVKSRVMRGNLELIPMNLKGSFETLSAAEARSVTKMNIDGVGTMSEGFDGKSGWSVNPITGSRDKAGRELVQAKLINDFYRDIRLEKLFPKIELRSPVKIGDRTAYVIEATADGLPPEKWYFDAATGLLIRNEVVAISPEGEMPISLTYEDYRPVEGVMTPFRIRTQTSQFEIVLSATEVKHRIAVDETAFQRPK